jgi:anti-sigma factor ChrR (cupin superfamily)
MIRARALGEVLPALVAGGWRGLRFEPFREGIAIARLYGAVDHGSSGAVLKYEPGASTPRHRHVGYETIVVLEGTQSDEAGTYRAGDLVVNFPGTIHRVATETGCVVLIIWQEPIEILDP